MKKLLLICGAIIFAAPVAASDFYLQGLNGGGSVFVWRDKEAHDEAMSLIASNVHQSNPSLVFRLLACMVESGTSAIVTDMGFVTHDIMVTSGENAGCRGNIPTESLKTR